jgi:hypothetical protein
MANPAHLGILKKGVEVWNKWREENPKLRPDLSGAYLSGADLRGAHLSGADFRLVYLRQANRVLSVSLSDFRWLGLVSSSTQRKGVCDDTKETSGVGIEASGESAEAIRSVAAKTEEGVSDSRGAVGVGSAGGTRGWGESDLEGSEAGLLRFEEPCSGIT